MCYRARLLFIWLCHFLWSALKQVSIFYVPIFCSCKSWIFPGQSVKKLLLASSPFHSHVKTNHESHSSLRKLWTSQGWPLIHPWLWLWETIPLFQTHGDGFQKPLLLCKAMANHGALVTHGQGAVGKPWAISHDWVSYNFKATSRSRVVNKAG